MRINFKKLITIKKQLAAWLIAFLLLTASVPFGAAQNRHAERIKAQVAKRNNGERTRVIVKTSDGKKFKGYVSRADTDAFELTDSKSGQATTLNYRDVEFVRKSGGISTTAIVTIAVGATLAIIVAVFVGRYCNNEGC